MELTPEGLICEADPRHADLLTDAFSLQKSNGVLTPGMKPPDADGEATKSAADELGHNIDEEVATIEPNFNRRTVEPNSSRRTVEPNSSRRSTERANTTTTDIGTRSDICRALSHAVVSFSDSPTLVHHFPCYAEITAVTRRDCLQQIWDGYNQNLMWIDSVPRTLRLWPTGANVSDCLTLPTRPMHTHEGT